MKKIGYYFAIFCKVFGLLVLANVSISFLQSIVSTISQIVTHKVQGINIFFFQLSYLIEGIYNNIYKGFFMLVVSSVIATVAYLICKHKNYSRNKTIIILLLVCSFAEYIFWISILLLIGLFIGDKSSSSDIGSFVVNSIKKNDYEGIPTRHNKDGTTTYGMKMSDGSVDWGYTEDKKGYPKSDISFKMGDGIYYNTKDGTASFGDREKGEPVINSKTGETEY